MKNRSFFWLLLIILIMLGSCKSSSERPKENEKPTVKKVEPDLSLDVSTPEDKGLRESSAKIDIEIVIDAKGKIFIKGKEVQLKDLSAVLLKMDVKTKIVGINGHKETDYKNVVNVMDQVLKCNPREITFAIPKNE